MPRTFTVLVALVAAALVACGGGGGDDSTYSVAFVNDTEAPVVFGLCAATGCTTLTSPTTLAPGDTYSVEATAGVPQWYAVTDEASTIQGCFELAFTTPIPGAGFLASEAGPCP